MNGLFSDSLDEVKGAFKGILNDDCFLVFSAPGPVRELSPENTWRRRSAELLREFVISTLSPDIVLTTSMVEGAEDDSIVSYGSLQSPITTVAVIYDLIPLANPDLYIGWEPAKVWYHGKIDSLRRADLLLSISEATKVDAISLLGLSPDRIVNISSAADESFSSANVSAAYAKTVAERFGIKKRYLMHSSAFEVRKNFHGLIRAFSTLPESIRANYQLVLVCKVSASSRQTVFDTMTKAGLRPDDVVLTGFVPDGELVALYVGCHLFVFPSLQEGFGLPALEAMSCGTATIGSNATSIPEVIGRPDALFDPASDESMAALMLKALTDQSFYESLKAHATAQSAKFSWSETARRAIAAIEDAHLRRKSAPPPTVDTVNRRQAFFDAVAKVAGECTPNEMEIVDLARCFEANNDAVERLQASTVFRKAMTWRVEGPFDSSYSLALLNRETARALHALGHTAILHSTEGPGDFDPNPAFLQSNPDIAAMHLAASRDPRTKAEVVSRNLYPPRVADMAGRLNLLHHYAWEESGFPPAWTTDFNTYLSGMTCLSTHVEKVLLDNGVHVPMTTSGCGVEHWERIISSKMYQVHARTFRFLHVSSCFPRKGIDVLLEAFGRAFANSDKVSLVIKTFANPHNDIHKLLAEHRSRRPHYPDVILIEDDLTPEDLKSLYEQCHVLIAPSKAEGFGLPLAEAMLSGLAVITTNWGGQLDFCTDSTAWLVDYDFELAETHLGLSDSVWASPHVDGLAEKLLLVQKSFPVETEEKTRAARQLLKDQFRWTNVAARLVTAAQSFERRVAERVEPRIGWMTTWNTKCGIASYSQQLIEQFPQRVTIFAPHTTDLAREDGSECMRSWSSSKEENHLDELQLKLAGCQIDVLVIQFNYGFYNFAQFKSFVLEQIESGRAVIVMMHATGDPGLEPAWNWSLSELVPALSRCQRILVHTVVDLNRLKNLGLVCNVALFPHGIVESRPSVLIRQERSLPLVATYGFCLPSKGLMELVAATAMLRDEGTPIRLRLVNAEYPDAVSSSLLIDLRRAVREKCLENLVEIYSEYLADQESLRLLQEADLITYPYQQTNESASGAVRLGLASYRPVAVTPIPIFEELSDSVHRFPGTQTADIALGLKTILSAVLHQTKDAKLVERSAEKWRSSRSYSELSKRLHGICKGLALKVSRYHRVFDGSTQQMRSSIGRIVGRSIESTGVEGFLLWGLDLAVPVGSYLVSLSGSHDIPVNSGAYADVCTKRGAQILGRSEFIGSQRGLIASVPISVQKRCKDLEIRVVVKKSASVRIDQLEIQSALVTSQPIERLSLTQDA